MERISNKHNPRIDDSMKEPDDSRAEEFRRGEGPAENEQDMGYQASRPEVESKSPDAMTEAAAEARGEIARFIDPSVFPARTDELVASAERNFAPEGIVERLRMLPDDRYETTEQVWDALGGRHEPRHT